MCFAVNEFPFAVCLIFQASLALALAGCGNNLSLRSYVKSGWRIINPACISEEQVSALRMRDTLTKAIMAVFAYTAVKGVAKVGTGAVSASWDGLHGMPASTGNPSKDVAIAERKLAEAQLSFSRGNSKYDKVLEAQRVLAYRKEKLHR